MRIDGQWLICDDGAIRPVIRGEVQAGDGSWLTVEFLVDSGADRTALLARVLHDNVDPGTVPVGEIMARPLPTLEVTTHLDEAYRLLLAGNTGVLAVSEGKVADIVTRIDLVHYYQARKRG